LEIDQLESQAVRAGRVHLHDVDHRQGRQWISGGFTTHVWNRSLGQLFFCALGANSTTGAGPYTHTITPGSLTGDSLTIQVGIPDTAGTVQPFTFDGCKVNTLTMEATAGELGMLSVDVIGQGFTTGTALASATYATGLAPLSFVHGSVSIAASSVANVEKFSLEINNGFEPRHFIGSATGSEPLQKVLQTVTGTLDMEFDGLTDFNRYANATQAALVLGFSDGTNSVTVTMNVRYDGSSPELNGTDVVKISQPFKALGSTDAAACTVVLVNSDATITGA
jgi:hypothetical protein